MKRRASFDAGVDAESEYEVLRQILTERDEARTERDEARKQLGEQTAMASEKLAAAHIECQLARAAAHAPCPHCKLYADWAVRVKTMNGHVYAILCPDGPETTIFWLKKKLAVLDPTFHTYQQIALVRQREISGNNDGGDGIGGDSGFLELENGQHMAGTLSQYGVMHDEMLDLLVRDIDWDEDCADLIQQTRCTGMRLHVNRLQCNADCQLLGQMQPFAIAWALTNKVC